MFRRFQLFFGVIPIAYLLLAYVESPQSLSFITPKGALWLEMIILSLLIVKFLLTLVAYSPNGSLFAFVRGSPWRVLELAALVASMVDFVTYFIKIDRDVRFPRFSRPLRVVYVANMTEDARATVTLILKTIISMAPKVGLLCIGFVGLFAMIGFCIFFANTEDPEYFIDFYTSFTEMFICLTATNFPDVMLPAYRKNRLSSAFFIAFLVLGTLVGLNILLGFNFTSFRTFRDADVASKKLRSKDALMMAFHQLANPATGSIPRLRFLQLFLYFRPEMSLKEGNNAFNAMDKDHSNSIDAEEFGVLADTLFLQFQQAKKGVPPKYPKLWRLMHNRYWSAFMQGMVLATGTVTVWTLQVSEGIFRPRWHFFLDLAILCTFISDVGIKMGGLGGPRAFLRTAWGKFEMTILLLCIVGKIVFEVFFGNRPDLFTPDDGTDRFTILRVACIFRCLKMILIVSVSEELRNLTNTLGRLTPQLLRFVGIIALTFFFYASLAVELFSGKLVPGAPELAGTDYEKLGYVGTLNFNSFADSLMLLFCLLMTNNWNTFFRATEAVTSRWSTFFFFSFILSVWVVILNLTVAYLLDSVAFNLALVSKARERKIKEAQALLGNAEKTPMQRIKGKLLAVARLNMAAARRSTGDDDASSQASYEYVISYESATEASREGEEESKEAYYAKKNAR